MSLRQVDLNTSDAKLFYLECNVQDEANYGGMTLIEEWTKCEIARLRVVVLNQTDWHDRADTYMKINLLRDLLMNFNSKSKVKYVRS